MNVRWVLVTRDHRVGFETLGELTEFARDFGITNWRPELVALTNARKTLTAIENSPPIKEV